MKPKSETPDFKVRRRQKMVWRTSDDREFETEELARKHSLLCHLEWILRDEYFGEGAGPADIAHVIREHWSEILKVMTYAEEESMSTQGIEVCEADDPRVEACYSGKCDCVGAENCMFPRCKNCDASLSPDGRGYFTYSPRYRDYCPDCGAQMGDP